MILEFDIPNGRMMIDLEEFAAKAGIRKVRKMFRMYVQSGPDPREARQVLEYLEKLSDQRRRMALLAAYMKREAAACRATLEAAREFLGKGDQHEEDQSEVSPMRGAEDKRDG